MSEVPASFPERWARTQRFAAGVPRAVTVVADGTVRYLRSGPEDHVGALYAFDPVTRAESLLASVETLVGAAAPAEDLPAAERARRERQRLRSGGIATYQNCADGRRIVVPVAGRVFVCDVRGVDVGGGVDVVEVDLGRPAVAPVASDDGTSLAWLDGGGVWVTAVEGGDGWVRPRRVTPDEDDDHVTWGAAEHIAAEELDRHEGFWWSPDARRLAVARVDTSDVETWWLADPATPGARPQPWPYPRPGRANAAVSLHVVDVHGGDGATVDWDTGRFPYLARVTWAPGAPLTLLVLDRPQTTAAILTVDDRTGAVTELAVETDPAWVNVPAGPLRRLPTTDDGQGDAPGDVVWVSEASGAAVVELIAVDGTRRRLTQPELGLRAVVGTSDGRVIVTASPDPTALRVAAVRIADGAVEWLDVDGDGDAAVGVHGWAGGHGVDVVNRRTPTTGARWWVRGAAAGFTPLPSTQADPGFTPRTTLHVVGAHDWRVACTLPTHLPTHLDDGARVPVLLDVYGGPSGPRVLQSRDDHLAAQWFADTLDAAVVSVDVRGTTGRGRDWERAIKEVAGDFATCALDDTLDALAALADELPVLDTSRVAIRGWSFGGYLAALAVLRRPDAVHGAVAGAPVTDWWDYDTAYTERYLGVPPPAGDATSIAAYERSGLLDDAARGLQRPLLCIHGTLDDNVFFSHSLRLTDLLTRAGATVDLLALPALTHMADDPIVSVRLWERTASFLAPVLHPGAAAVG